MRGSPKKEREMIGLPERNRNVDMLRAFALLWMIAYHAWVQCGSVPFRFSILTLLIELGGEMGVTGFFLLSGYSIYCSLRKSEQQKKISFIPFMKKRFKRVCFQYYFVLIVALLFTSGSVYLQRSHIWNIISHIFFIHNWFPNYAGAINGVLWTMGVIVQFYIVAIPLYKLINKGGTLTGLISVAFTILCKYMAYMWLKPVFQTESVSFFFLGRQLPTALDNFVIGMAVAYLIYNRNKRISRVFAWTGCTVAFLVLVAVSKLGVTYGIYANTILGYIWHSTVALTLGVILFCFFFVKVSHTNIVSKFILWIADNEYGTYIWHLLMFNNLIAGAPFIVNLLTMGHRKTVYLILVGLALVVGWMFTKVENGLKGKGWI